MSLPHDAIPVNLVENLKWRRSIRSKASHSVSFRRELVRCCADDLLFFANGFCWTYDPKRHPDAPDRPFIAWPFQVPILEEMFGAIGRRDVVLVKSRDVGGSLMPLIISDHRLLFGHGQSVGLMSRTMGLVGAMDDPDSLFHKLDYMHRWMPDWLSSGITRKTGPPPSLVNDLMKNRIIGASTTRDANRGGRKQLLVIDEFSAFEPGMSLQVLAATQHASRSRFFVSTPRGIGNAFHKLATDGSRRVLRVHWSDHPVHGAGLYTAEDGKVKLLDRDYWRRASRESILAEWPEIDQVWSKDSDSYPYILDGKLRSPYYDSECLRCPIPGLIAQELDMDFVGSGSPFFDPDAIRAYVSAVCCTPYRRGELDGSVWHDVVDGRFSLWTALDGCGRPNQDRSYMFGIDVSQGTGFSNSVLSIGDARTHSKVGSFVTPYLNPHLFADQCARIIEWFGGGSVIADGGGPGGPFSERMHDLGVRQMYRHKSRTNSTHPRSKFGWFAEDRDGKRMLLANYSTAILRREFTNPDRLAVEECLQYEFTTADRIEHVGSRVYVDPSGAAGNHGDRVMADALLWKLLGSVPECRPKLRSGGSAMTDLILDYQAELDGEVGDW